MNAKRRRFLLPLLIVIPVVVGVLLELAAAGREGARRTRCRSQLKALHYGLVMYALDYEVEGRGGPFPQTFGVLYTRYISDGSCFLCLSAGKATPVEDDPDFSHDNYAPAMFGDTHTDYVYVSRLRETDPPHYVLGFEDEWNHDGDGVNVMVIGGIVEWWDVKALHGQLAEQEKELAAKGRKMKLLRPAWSSWPDPPAGGRPLRLRHRVAVALGACAGIAVALALVVRTVRRGRKRRGEGADGGDEQDVGK